MPSISLVLGNSQTIALESLSEEFFIAELDSSSGCIKVNTQSRLKKPIY